MNADTKTNAEIQAVKEYIKSNPNAINSDSVSKDILKLTYGYFDAHNSILDKSRSDEKWHKSHKLTPVQIAEFLRLSYDIRRIDLISKVPDEKNRSRSDLAIYDSEKGIYYMDEEQILKRARKIERSLTKKEIEEILLDLKDAVPITVRTQDPDLIPVNNGIFNYKTKELMPFSPDYVYLTKCPVDYVPNAVNPVLHNDDDGTDWDVEDWMQSLSDDREIIDLLWQVLGAVIRPGVRWNKAAYLYATSGNNGKGTFCELARALCGENNCVSISIKDFDSMNSFNLEPLLHANAVITDENDVDTYIDSSKNLKTAITGDMLCINRKYKAPIAYKFQGFIIQCLNDLPRIKDKSDSYARRQLLIPFDKCFTGAERKYIKQDYLYRKNVLEYVLYKILQTNYYELSCPKASVELMEEYQVVNDPVRGFCEEIVVQLKWEFVPFIFLYELYGAWMKAENPNGKPLNAKNFVNRLLDTLKSKNFGFYCDDKRKTVRTNNKMDKPEPLIAEYGLTRWMNPSYSGKDLNKLCIPDMPAKKEKDRGILKKP